MKRFIGLISILIGSIGLIITSFIGIGSIIYLLINRELSVLIETDYIEGWVSLILLIVNSVFAILYSSYALRIITLGRVSKRSLYISLIYFVIEIFRIIYSFYNLGTNFSLSNVFIVIAILNIAFYVIQASGFILNYKKTLS